MIIYDKDNYHIHINTLVSLLYYEYERIYFTFGMFITDLATAKNLFALMLKM